MIPFVRFVDEMARIKNFFASEGLYQFPSVYPELTEKLVRRGITSVSVSPDMIDETRYIIAAAEKKLENHKNVVE